jgi:hypothetical protein
MGIAVTNPVPAFGVPRLLRGSLVVQRRRCGKRNCRCAKGTELHETPAVSYTRNGRTRTVVLSESEVEAVRAAIGRYRTAVAELQTAADAGITALRDRRQRRG